MLRPRPSYTRVECGHVPVVHIERWGDERLLTLALALTGVEIRREERAAQPDELWNLLDEPKAGYCCQDAYASVSRAEPPVHTGGCPNRCSQRVPIPDAQARGLPAAYPCPLTRGHAGQHEMHPEYRKGGAGV